MPGEDGGGSDALWPAGELGSILTGDISDNDIGPVDDLSRLVDEPEVIAVASRVAIAYERHDPEKDFKDTRIYRELLRKHGNQTASRALEDGNASRLQGLTGHIDHSTDANEARLKLLDRMTAQAFLCFISGPPGSGKTNEAMRSAEWWETGIRDHGDYGTIVTNVPVEVPGTLEVDANASVALVERSGGSRVPIGDALEYDAGELALTVNGDRMDVTGARIVIAYRETHMKKIMAAVHGPALAVVDEWATWGGGDKGRDRDAADEILRFARMIRKQPFLGSMMAIGHANTDANKTLRENLTFCIAKQKGEQKRARVYQELTSSGPQGAITTIRDVPRTQLRYPDRQQPFFIFDGGEGDDRELSTREREMRAQALRDAGVPVTSAGDGEMAIDEDPVVDWTDTAIYEKTYSADTPWSERQYPWLTDEMKERLEKKNQALASSVA